MDAKTDDSALVQDTKCKKRKVSRNHPIEIGVHTIQQRAHEDRYAIFKTFGDNDRFTLLMVCDGHANNQKYDHKSPHIVDEVVILLPIFLQKHLQTDVSVKDAIQEAFLDVDRVLYDETRTTHFGGATCNLVLIDFDTLSLYNANLGDSRLIICDVDDNLLFESKDHTFLNDYSRLKEARHTFSDNHVYAIDSETRMNINVARAFGDFMFKTTGAETRVYDGVRACISAKPFITSFKLNALMSDNESGTKNKVRLYLTTDGPFDAQSKLSSEEFVELQSPKSMTVHERCADLAAKAAERTSDDITIVVAEISPEVHVGIQISSIDKI